MEAQKKTLGGKIKFLREANGFTQEEFRKMLGYNSTGIMSQIENDLCGMSIEKIIEAAKLLNVHPAILLSPDGFTEDDLLLCVNLLKIIKHKNENPKHASKHLPSIKSLLELAESQL